MDKSVFLPLLHTEFRVPLEGRAPVTLRLVEVSDLERRPATEPRRGKRGFALLFNGPRELLLPQAMHTFEHEALGAFDLFIVPVHPEDDEHFYYEAIFNFR